MKQIEPSELLEMVKGKSLVEVVLYYWLGRWVSEKERQILEEMMVLCVDHGPDSPSATATREAAVSGEGLLASVRAGAATINESHGGAIEGCAGLLLEEDFGAKRIVGEALEEGRRLPGFGHRVYKTQDPRATYLEARSQELGLGGKYWERAREIELELEKKKGKKLVLNIDGGMAAIMCELEIKPELMNGFFLWPRVAGLIYRARAGLK